jgi:hypothetical protein
MHGSPPRTLVEYRSAPSAKHGMGTKKSLDDFRAIRSGILVEQAEYFDTIGIDESYLLRFRELARGDDVLSAKVCKRQRRYVLMLDREYFDAFGIPVLNWEQSGDESQVKEMVVARFSSYVVLYGLFGQRISVPENDVELCRRLRTPEIDRDRIF